MNKIDKLAKIIWDYNLLNHKLEKSDLLLALGTYDTRVAKTTAELYLKGYAPLILLSGNKSSKRGNLSYGVPEAIRFKEIMIEMNVPESAIITEVESTNTGQNILNSSKLLTEMNIHPKSVIVVQKPYMERRTYATLMAQWPNPKPKFIITSQKISFEDYVKHPVYNKEFTINAIVGDLQRIKEYPKLGFQITQIVPEEVWAAYEELVRLGYTKRLIN